ncbi:MAG: bis(5'-nucleosyl)-tetraphosphatase (symmetrical) YqeK [Sphaerochaeta sp.]
MSKTIDSTALEANLTPKRLQHSRSVTQLCHYFNDHYSLHADHYDLTTVGLGHDIARSWSEAKLKAYIKANNLHLIEGEAEIPELLHAPVGAHILKTMGAREAITSAIRYHTLGSVEMGSLGYILFVSDYLDPNRSFLSREDRSELLRAPTIENLVYQILNRSVAYLQREGKPIFDVTSQLIAELEGR